MNRVPDRRQQRREYLRKKARIFTAMSIVSALVIVFCCSLWIPTPARYIVLAIAWLALSIVERRRLTLKAYYRRLKELPYVPPATPSALPAEEILVRGASSPAAPNEILLRATVKDGEAKAEELLRIVPGAKEESK